MYIGILQVIERSQYTIRFVFFYWLVERLPSISRLNVFQRIYVFSLS